MGVVGRMNGRRWRRAVAGGIGGLALSGMLVTPAEAEPTFRAIAACGGFPGSDYVIQVLVSGLPPSESYFTRAFDGHLLQSTFLDSNEGSGPAGYLIGSEPWTGWLRLYHDANHNFEADPGEPLVAAINITVPNPCQDGIVSPK